MLYEKCTMLTKEQKEYVLKHADEHSAQSIADTLGVSVGSVWWYITKQGGLYALCGYMTKAEVALKLGINTYEVNRTVPKHIVGKQSYYKKSSVLEWLRLVPNNIYSLRNISNSFIKDHPELLKKKEWALTQPYAPKARYGATEEEELLIHKLYKEGLPIRVISEKVGRSSTTIRRWLGL